MKCLKLQLHCEIMYYMKAIGNIHLILIFDNDSPGSVCLKSSLDQDHIE